MNNHEKACISLLLDKITQWPEQGFNMAVLAQNILDILVLACPNQVYVRTIAHKFSLEINFLEFNFEEVLLENFHELEKTMPKKLRGFSALCEQILEEYRVAPSGEKLISHQELIKNIDDLLAELTSFTANPEQIFIDALRKIICTLCSCGSSDAQKLIEQWLLLCTKNPDNIGVFAAY